MTNLPTETLFNETETANSKQIAILKKHFPQCFDKHGHFHPEKMMEVVKANEVEIVKESYSLNWLGQSYARLLTNLPPQGLLKPDTAHNSAPQNSKSENLLIKGDNLEVLKHLVNGYPEQIKMIYIDPPYNTGSDGFVYQDSFKFSVDDLSRLAGIDKAEAERVLSFITKGSNSHSAWLTFMYPRLYIARKLLKDDGFIVISINDNELAQLKILCDYTFGEENFITDVAIQMSHLSGVKMSHRHKTVPKIKESILIYCMNSNSINIKDEFVESTWEESLDRYTGYISNFEQDDICAWERITVRQAATDANVDVSDYNEYLAFKLENAERIIRTATNDSLKDIKKEKKFSKIISATGLERLVYNGEEVLFASRFVRDGRVYSYIGDIWTDIGINNLHNEGGVPFKNGKKPLKLIQRLIRMFTEKDSLILDFFAGSGTTGHAVYLQNHKDSGNRKFISVQIEEEIENINKNKDLISFISEMKVNKNVFEVTKLRLLNGAEEVRTKGLDYNGDLGFKIYETTNDFRPKIDGSLDLSNESLLEDIVLSDEQYQALLTTWMLYDNNHLTQQIEDVALQGYKAHLVDKGLYLIDSDFRTENLKHLLEKLDADKSFAPNRIIVNGYNFDTAMQMELNEAIKSYQNKKSISINVVVRY